MTTQVIECHAETLNDANQWEAVNRDTFEIVSAPGNQPWAEMIPTLTVEQPVLTGLLIMNTNKVAYPFSFGERGFPKNASREVTKVWLDATESSAATYLTREDIEGKIGELMIVSHRHALMARPHLVDLLRELPEHHGDPKHQRIVCWCTE